MKKHVFNKKLIILVIILIVFGIFGYITYENNQKVSMNNADVKEIMNRTFTPEKVKEHCDRISLEYRIKAPYCRIDRILR